MGVSVIQQEMRELLGPWLPWRTVSHNQRVKPQTSFVKKMQLQVVRRNQGIELQHSNMEEIRGNNPVEVKGEPTPSDGK